MKQTLHLLAEDLGCVSKLCNCDSDAWLAPALADLLARLGRLLAAHAEFARLYPED